MIKLRKLIRIQGELERFHAEIEASYPGLHSRVGEWSSPLTETVRNSDTALAEIACWIAYRKNNRSDPEYPTEANP